MQRGYLYYERNTDENSIIFEGLKIQCTILHFDLIAQQKK